jgi:signal transduction histidine kinase
MAALTDERPIQPNPAYGAPPRYEGMLAALAHDLKNPLALIRANAQLLTRRLGRTASPDAASIQAGLGQIEAATRRMALLLDDLLDAGTIGEAELPDLELRPTDLVALARQVASAHEAATDRHRIEVESPACAPVVGLWDAGRLERVLTNLVSNALKFSPDGGEVRLAVAAEGEWAVLTVRDHGIGIPPAEVERVFAPFYRAGNAVGHLPGTGLGLAGARRVVAAHGGTVRVVASAPGEGTTIEVRLPLRPMDPAPGVAG